MLCSWINPALCTRLKLLSHRLWSRGSPPPVLRKGFIPKYPSMISFVLRFIMIQKLNIFHAESCWTNLVNHVFSPGITHRHPKNPATTPLQPMVEVLLDSAEIQPGDSAETGELLLEATSTTENESHDIT